MPLPPPSEATPAKAGTFCCEELLSGAVIRTVGLVVSEIVRYTVTVCPLLEASGSTTKIVATCSPRLNELVLIETVTTSVSIPFVASPLVGVRPTHESVVVTVQFNFVKPVFLIVNDCDGGLPAPWATLKLRVSGLRKIVGC